MSSPVIRLYSASPRRRDLMNQAGLPFTVHPTDTDETVPPGTGTEEAARLISRRKLDAALTGNPENIHHWGLAADTLVEGPGGPFGKPGDRDEACSMLRALSGTSHRVVTGLALWIPEEPEQPAQNQQDPRNETSRHPVTETVVTTVGFRSLSQNEIDRYLDTNEWQGVAGAYRIQGRAALFINHLEGIWSNVVGLPLSALYGMLTRVCYPFE